MKDFLNFFTKNLLLHILQSYVLNKIVTLSGEKLSKFLLIRPKFSSLLENTLIDENLDESNMRFKEIVVFRDYKNNIEIALLSKNIENKRYSLSEIVTSAYLLLLNVKIMIYLE
jgi:hypothetical protein